MIPKRDKFYGHMGKRSNLHYEAYTIGQLKQYPSRNQGYIPTEGGNYKIEKITYMEGKEHGWGFLCDHCESFTEGFSTKKEAQDLAKEHKCNPQT